MVPKIGEDTRSPDDPSWTYSTLVALTLLCNEEGTGIEGGGILEASMGCQILAELDESLMLSFQAVPWEPYISVQ